MDGRNILNNFCFHLICRQDSLIRFSLECRRNKPEERGRKRNKLNQREKHTHIHEKRDRQTDRPTDRQTETETDRQTETERERDRERERQREREDAITGGFTF